VARAQIQSDRRNRIGQCAHSLQEKPPQLTLGTDPVMTRAATDPLAFATAALAARSRGARALAQHLPGTAQMAIENLSERCVRPEQTRGRRRHSRMATIAASSICDHRRRSPVISHDDDLDQIVTFL
jgi:hypothetical protein